MDQLLSVSPSTGITGKHHHAQSLKTNQNKTWTLGLKIKSLCSINWDVVPGLLISFLMLSQTYNPEIDSVYLKIYYLLKWSWIVLACMLSRIPLLPSVWARWTCNFCFNIRMLPTSLVKWSQLALLLSGNTWLRLELFFLLNCFSLTGMQSSEIRQS